MSPAPPLLESQRAQHFRKAPKSLSDATPEKQKGHVAREQRELPRTEVVHEVDAADRACTACGKALTLWVGQEEASDEATVVERCFVVLTHRRQKMH